MMDEEMDILKIMALPEEMRSLIFNFIPQKETVNLRLVCKIWNKEIENNYEYNIDKLDEDSTDFKSIIQLRIKTLRIHKLEITPIFINGTSIFKHPNAVQKLVIGSNAFVSPFHLQELIHLFSKKLLVLDVNVNARIHNYQFPSGLNFNFEHLKHICIRKFLSFEKCEDNPRSIFQVLENSSFSNLKILDVNLETKKMTFQATSRIVGNLLRLISKHGKYLEHLSFNIPLFSHLDLDLVIIVNILLYYMVPPVLLREEELLRIKEIQSLKKVFLFQLPVGSGISAIWSEVICKQKQLTELQIDLYELSLFKSIILFKQVTANNSATLNKLEILGLQLSSLDPPFDLSIFKNCEALKTLKLDMASKARMVRRNPEEPDVINFHCLPENIIELGLSYLKVLSEELVISLRPSNITGDKGFNKLEQLSLKDCGDQGPVGVNALVFYQVLMTPSLTNVYFRGIHQGEASMKTALTFLQLANDTDFRLQRDSREHGWKRY